MKKGRNIISAYSLLLLGMFLCSFQLFGANEMEGTIVEGQVIDSITKEKLPYVAVQIEGTSIGSMTDDDGNFRFISKSPKPYLLVSSLGYTPKKIPLKIGKSNKLTVYLVSSTIQLEEVVVKRKKEKYNKKNPAVELIEKVIANKKKNSPKSMDYYQCEHYEKTVVSLNNLKPPKDTTKKKTFSFVQDYVDTSDVTGKRILAMSIKELVEQHYYRKEPKGLWKLILGKTSSGIDDFMDEDGMRAFLRNVFTAVDLYDNDIDILLTRFPSPLSSTLGTSYYKYYIEDTVEINGKRCVHLSFAPFNPQSYGFVGHLYIADDSTHALVKDKLNIPKATNVNYVENLYLTQEFEESPEGIYCLKKNDLTIEMSLYGMKQGAQVRRIDMYKDYLFNQPREDIYKHSDKEIFHESVENRDDKFWEENRQLSIREKEDAIDALINKLRKVPFFGEFIRLAEILISGYIETHPDHDKSSVDLGPMNTTISYNSVEGLRLRAGAMTTANLFPNLFKRRLFFKGYVAYGFKDEKLKYN
ncbi:MAG TPA: hypothetical protein DDY68_02050, partial [Porphyromonadaceae bacterium]|nr:hypothetical protein [Porphyromonadaceae bacterium]